MLFKLCYFSFLLHSTDELRFPVSFFPHIDRYLLNIRRFANPPKPKTPSAIQHPRWEKDTKKNMELKILSMAPYTRLSSPPFTICIYINPTHLHFSALTKNPCPCSPLPPPRLFMQQYSYKTPLRSDSPNHFHPSS